jgi:putative spermidine/putrescine transport system permease protein
MTQLVTSAPRVPAIKVRTGSRWLSMATATLWRVFMALLIAFIVLPTVMVFPLALTSGGVLRFPPPALSFEHVLSVVRDATWRQAFVTSIEVAVIAAAIAVVLGTALAVVIPKRGPLRIGLEASAALPLVIPPVVLAVAWFNIFGVAHLLYRPLGVGIAHALLGLPFVYLNVAGALNSLDPQLSQAARSLGARPIVVFGRITLPLVMPGIMAGAILTAVFSFDELILALFLGGGMVGTIPVKMWAEIQYVTSPEVAAVAMIATTVTIACVGAVLTARVLTSGRRK